MKLSWSKVVFPIAGLYACRMFGLFLLIPVFTLFATELKGGTPQLVGIAFGAYGLAQALMQIPFGLFSDKFGRKPVIGVGLVLLMLGSLMGALTDSIWGMIVARMVQGFGAIGSVLLALLSDLTPVSDRAKAMAAVGITIGLSFSLALMISPLITQYGGLSSLFYFMTGLSGLGLFLLFIFIPNPPALSSPLPPKPFAKSLRNPVLQKLNLGILIQHACLTALFYVLPLRLKAYMLMGKLTETWHFYLPVVLISFLIMAPMIAVAEKKQKLDFTLKISIFVLFLSQLSLMWFASNWTGLILNVFIYFVAFNLLEALLPSQVARFASPEQRGTAMGIYSTYQFLGIFLGGVLAGWVYPLLGETGVFGMNMGMCLVWLGLSIFPKSSMVSCNRL